MTFQIPTTLGDNVANTSTTVAQKEASVSLLSKYMAYADSQSKLRVYWFLKVVLIIPCALMVLSIIAMATITPNYIWFVALSMVLFFANVIIHIGEAKSSVYVPVFHATVILFFAIPSIAYLLSLNIQ